MPRRSGTPSLLPLLRSRTQAELLERLILHPDVSYTVADLARDLAVTDMSVRRELERMLDAGIIEREAVGRQGIYRASTASPLFQPLHELVEKSLGVEVHLRELLEETPGVEGAAIFGSWARGRIDAESDVDLLVVGDIDYGALLEKLIPLQSKIDRQISVVWMRPEEFHTADRSAFIREVLAGPLRVLAGQVEQG
jgi:predicted nucleotidyltransferase